MSTARRTTKSHQRDRGTSKKASRRTAIVEASEMLLVAGLEPLAILPKEKRPAVKFSDRHEDYDGYLANCLEAFFNGANLAVLLPGLVLIDEDGIRAGRVLNRAEARLGDLPATYEQVGSGSPGRRSRIFRIPEGLNDLGQILSAAPPIGAPDHPTRLDIKSGPNFCCVIPPSVHPSGTIYRQVSIKDLSDAAVLPTQWHQEISSWVQRSTVSKTITDKNGRTRLVRSHTVSSGSEIARIDPGLVVELQKGSARVSEGSRNEITRQLTKHLFRNSRHLSQRDVVRVVDEINRASFEPPLPRDEIARTVGGYFSFWGQPDG